MEAKTAFVRPNSAVELYTPATVNLNFTFIVYPGNTESDLAFWFYDTTKDVSFFKFRVSFYYTFDGFENFFYSLDKFWLFAVTSFNVF